MKNTWMLLAMITCGVLALTVIGLGARSIEPTSETYAWSGELVGFDANTRMISVKSRVVGDQALTELPRFKAGDRIILTWSGFDTYADAILRTTRYDSTKKWNEPFTFPVEFVAYEPARQYVTFKFQVPATSLESLKAVKPGEWVTATARHRAASETEAITAVNAFGASVAHRGTN